MLRHELDRAADLVVRGWTAPSPKQVTYDFARLMDGAKAETSEFGDAIIPKHVTGRLRPSEHAKNTKNGAGPAALRGLRGFVRMKRSKELR